MRHSASSAEQDFLSRLMGDIPMEKGAVDLDPGSIEALGIPSVSPGFLDELEGQASSIKEPAAADEEPEEEQAAAAAPAAQQVQPVEVEGFDRTDHPPELEEGEEPAAEPELPSRSTFGRIFTDKRASPIKILEVLTSRYGTEWTDWEPDTLWWSLRRDFGPVGEIARNKIGALRLAATTDVPWLDWDVFEDSGLSWNDVVPIIGTFQPMTPMQTAFAVTVLHGIRADEAFDPEVKAYIAAILEDAGWVYAPAEYFDGAQELLDRRVWLVGFRQQVAQAWEKLKDVDPTSVDWNYDNPLDVHILKLMTVKYYIQERQALRDKVLAGTTSSSTVQPPVP